MVYLVGCSHRLSVRGVRMDADSAELQVELAGQNSSCFSEPSSPTG